jgi:hypothetical protein
MGYERVVIEKCESIWGSRPPSRPMVQANEKEEALVECPPDDASSLLLTAKGNGMKKDVLSKLNKETLLALVRGYDLYIVNYMETHGLCKDGCCPVCLDEFYHCEFMEKN